MKLSNLLLVHGVFFSWFMTTKMLLATDFSKQKIDDTIKKEMIDTQVWSENCPIHFSRLSLVSFPFYDFNGKVQHGELIVLDAVADHILAIMQELYTVKFPMETVRRIESYSSKNNGKYILDLPIEHNNSSSFYCRPIKGSNMYSLHAFGAAIDINPQQNPYVIIQDPNSSEVKNRKPQEHHIVYVEPFAGAYYLNRSNIRPGMITTQDEVVKLFYKHGFVIWGGNWNYPIDTQHFQLTREIADLLTQMSSSDAKYFFNIYVKSPALKIASLNDKAIINNIENHYKKDAKKLMVYIKNNEKDFIDNPSKVMLNYS